MDNSQTPKISIIMPVYKAEKYICQSIDSIIAQTFTDWELILVVDGSPDRSPEICDAYSAKDSRIKTIHKDNEGVAIARKTGCDKARAKYIGFADSDDTLDSTCLEKCMQLLGKYDTDILVFGSIWRNEASGKEEIKNPEFEGYYDKEMIRRDIFPVLIQTEQGGYYPQSIWRNIFKRENILPYMIVDRRATVGEDGACVIPAIFHADSIFFHKEPLYHYRVNTDSVTGGRRVFNWDYPEATARHIENMIDINEADLRDQLYRRLCHDVFNVCVSRFYGNKGYKETAAEIRQNLRRDIYRNAIKKARFKGSKKAALMMLALRSRSVLLMYLYSGISK